MKKIEPSAQQLAIINLDKGKFLIEAGAGTGKTFVLTKRIYQLVWKHQLDIDELLVLTFTDKAASEMKQRTMMEFASSTEPFMKQQLSKILNAHIMTFDSFYLELLKKYASSVGISNQITPLETTLFKVQRNKIIIDTLNKYYQNQDPQSPFCQFIFHYTLKNDDFLVDFLIKIFEDLDRYDDANLKIQALRDSICSSEILRKYQDYLQSYAKEFSQSFTQHLDNVSNLEELVFILNHLDLNGDILAQLEGLNVRQKKGYANEEYKNLWEQFKKFKSTLLPLGCRVDQVQINNNIITWHRLIYDIVSEVFHNVAIYNHNHNFYTFNEIAKKVLRLIKDHEDIRQEIQHQFKYILIDEYQDTSDIQNEFIELIANNNLFMVGDLKQSIYSFRNANPQNMKAMAAQKEVQTFSLNISQRSNSQIIDFINQLFSKIMFDHLGGIDFLAKEQLLYPKPNLLEEKNPCISLINVLAPSDEANQMVEEEKDFPENSFLADGVTNRRIGEILAIIHDIQTKMNSNYLIVKDGRYESLNYSDFCLIPADTIFFKTIIKLFHKYQIPLNVEGVDKDTRESEVYLLMRSIIKYIVLLDRDSCPQYDLTHLFVSIARSFLYPNTKSTDEQIYDILHHGDYQKTIIHQNILKLQLYSKTHSVKESINEILSIFNFDEALLSLADYQKNQSKLSAFYQLASSFDQYYFTLEQFSQFLDDIEFHDLNLENPGFKENAQAVHLINIHKAKGLEYHICYYPFLEKPSINDFKGNFLYHPQFGLSLPSTMDFHNYQGAITQVLIKDAAKLNITSEKIRLFYVALTRAKSQIIFLNSQEIKPYSYTMYPDNFLEFLQKADLWSKMNIYEGKNPQLVVKNAVEDLLEPFKAEDIIDPQPIIQQEVKSASNKLTHATTQQIEFGIKLHAYLESLDFHNPSLNHIIEPNIKKYLARVLQLDLFKPIKKAQVFPEYEFYQTSTNLHGIIDLLLVYEDHWEIIDYKTKNIDDEEYARQLKVYEDYLKTLTPLPIKKYLLSIVDGTYIQIT
ncbi:MAG: UvrD-helicase domain-containing protein [Acholeplasmatales bacterium]|jgi:ATP-dependent helicase/nuclease subunit A|nr:UvrD-helicase domain-containing protein [Acholeplasmatales bacterium]